MNEVRIVANMAIVRGVGALLELAAAVWMVRSGSVATALKINTLLGLAGPAVLLLVSALGLLGIVSHLAPAKIGLVALGVALVWVGTR